MALSLELARKTLDSVAVPIAAYLGCSGALRVERGGAEQSG